MSTLKRSKMKPTAKTATEKTATVSESFRNPDTTEQDMKPLNDAHSERASTQIQALRCG